MKETVEQVNALLWRARVRTACGRTDFRCSCRTHAVRVRFNEFPRCQNIRFRFRPPSSTSWEACAPALEETSQIILNTREVKELLEDGKGRRKRATKAGSSSQKRESSSSSSSLPSTVDDARTLSGILSKEFLEHASDEKIRRVLSSGLITPGDVARVRAMLLEAGNIPPDIASAILDQAGYWAVVAAESSESMKVSRSKSPYLTIQVPSDCASGSVKALAVRCVAHDQGWSDYRENKGTYHNSWTTFELTVRGADGQSVHTVHRFFTNMHANSDWQTHAVTLVAGDEMYQGMCTMWDGAMQTANELLDCKESISCST
eukprot:gene25815-11490_t